MIPKLASLRAVIASVIAEISITLLYLHMSKNMISTSMVLCRIWRRFLAGMAMLLAIVWIGRNFEAGFLPILLQVISGIVIYVDILLLLRDPELFDLWTILKKCLLRMK